MASTSWFVRGWVAGIAVALGGCSSIGAGGGANVASLETPVVAPVRAAPAPVVYGAFLDGPAGSRLPEPDRVAALAAENGAIGSGERRTWKGARGVYGFVEPGAMVVGGAGECRGFTHTIYFAGRPQTGKGTGCKDVDGTWHVTS